MNDEPEPKWVDEDSALAPVEVELREIGEILGAGFSAMLGGLIVFTPPGLTITAGWYIGKQFGHPFEEIGFFIGALFGVVFLLGVVENVKE